MDKVSYTSIDGKEFETLIERDDYDKTFYGSIYGDNGGGSGSALSDEELKTVGRVFTRLLMPGLIYWLCVYPGMTASWLLENSSLEIFRLSGKLFYSLWLTFIKVVGFPICFLNLNDQISLIAASAVWFMVLSAVIYLIQKKFKKLAKTAMIILIVAAVTPVLLMIIVSLLGFAGPAADMKVYGYDPYSWGLLWITGGYNSIMAPPFMS